jgi:hypothetical protein
MCFEDEWRSATLAGRQTCLYADISGEFKLVRAPEKEYFLLIYRISVKDARKKNGCKEDYIFSTCEKQKVLPKSG